MKNPTREETQHKHSRILIEYGPHKGVMLASGNFYPFCAAQLLIGKVVPESVQPSAQGDNNGFWQELTCLLSEHSDKTCLKVNKQKKSMFFFTKTKQCHILQFKAALKEVANILHITLWALVNIRKLVHIFI